LFLFHVSRCCHGSRPTRYLHSFPTRRSSDLKAINTFDPVKKIKLATYASRCIENEILMYLRRNSKTKLEVSIDEPLNVDWDGNELLLSDILGTDEDVIYKDIENEVERKLLGKAIGKLTKRGQTIVRLRFG